MLLAKTAHRSSVQGHVRDPLPAELGSVTAAGNHLLLSVRFLFCASSSFIALACNFPPYPVRVPQQGMTRIRNGPAPPVFHVSMSSKPLTPQPLDINP